MSLTKEQKIKKLQRLVNSGDPVGVFNELETLEKQLEDARNAFKKHITAMDGILRQLERKKLNTSEFQAFGGEVKQAIQNIQLIPGPKGDKGDSYVLTNRDKQEIALDIKVPIVEKITERIETIKEQPIIQVKEVAMADTPDQVAGKLNTLEEAVEQNVIIGLVEEIKKLREEIRLKPTGGMRGMKKITSVRSVDLSGSVDGAVYAFTLPADTLKVLGVWSSQFPLTLRDGIDFTFSGRTLTIVTAQVGIPQSGQTLHALIECAFYA